MYRNRIGSVALSCISKHATEKVASYSNTFSVLPHWCMLWAMQLYGPLATNTYISGVLLQSERNWIINKTLVNWWAVETYWHVARVSLCTCVRGGM